MGMWIVWLDWKFCQTYGTSEKWKMLFSAPLGPGYRSGDLRWVVVFVAPTITDPVPPTPPPQDFKLVLLYFLSVCIYKPFVISKFSVPFVEFAAVVRLY